MKMNFGLQKNKLSKLLGSNRDLYDLHAKIDRNLTYRENKNIILKEASGFGLFKKKESFGSLNKLDNYIEAEEYNRKRTAKSQRMDDRKQAVTTFSQDQLNKKNYSKWRKNPNRYDVEGVDSRW